MLNYEGLAPLVKRAAKAAHSSFPDHHDQADTEQALWVFLLEQKEYRTSLTEGALMHLLVAEANKQLKKEDAASYSYSEQDAYRYPIHKLESILEGLFEYENWQSFATKLDDMPRVKGNPAHGNTHVVEYADVKAAVEKLPEDQYNAIIWRYKYEYTFEAMGAEMGISRQAARERWKGAVANVQRILGRIPLTELRNGHSGRTDPSTTQSSLARVERDYNG